MEVLLVAVSLVIFAAAGLMLLREARRSSSQSNDPKVDPVDKTLPREAKRSSSESSDPKVDPADRVVRDDPLELPSLEPVATEDSFGADLTETPSHSVTLYEAGAEPEEPTASKPFFVLEACGLSDPGRRRKRNEDSILLLKDPPVFVVADGMGGQAAGDVASKLAVETIEAAFQHRRFPKGAGDARRPWRAHELISSMHQANRKIREESKSKREYGEMGATIIGARFSERKQRVYIGYVGDSRCYRLRGDRLQLLTRDHTLADFGVEGPLGGRVRRALGAADRVTVDLYVDRPEAGDVYVLCSDGLNTMLDHDSIGRIVAKSAGDLDRAARELIDAANAAGGRDNVSVILVGVRQARAGRDEGAHSLGVPRTSENRTETS